MIWFHLFKKLLKITNLWKDKNQAFNSIGRLAVIGVSDWITDEVRKSPMFKNAKIIKRIYNWVDYDKYSNTNKSDIDIRKKYNIGNRKIILGVASNWTNNKGLDKFEKLSLEIGDEYVVVLVGNGELIKVNDKLINDCIESVEKFGSAITVVPAIETIVSIENGEIQTITDRSKCYHAKAPQCFILGELIAAHRKALQENLTNMIDSASLMKYYGHSLHTVSGNYDNIKITTPTDFYTSRALYEVRENQQIFGL